ncbi:MAG TPA: YceI family protein [Mycobacteriales bacterium]|nr:YceI family protein [Mycobacteriales bacterium]
MTLRGVGSSQASIEIDVVEQEAAHRVGYDLDPASSVVLIEARSTVGPIEFATSELTGFGSVAVDQSGDLDFGDSPEAVVQLRVEALTSGNALYDAEVRRRLDARRYPTITARLLRARAVGRRWALEAEITIHGTTRVMSCAADVETVNDNVIRIHGSHVVDMRDFAISVPSVLMLRIYPDVTVRCRIDAVKRS